MSFNILDLDAPEVVKIKTGYKLFDHLTEGGLPLSSAILFSGRSGGGKSTVLRILCDKLTSARVETLYLSAEEAPSQVQQGCRRLGLRYGFSFKNVNNAADVHSELALAMPKVAIIDSLQAIVSNGNLQKIFVRSLTQWAQDNNGVIILVGHVTKAGKAAGPETLIHLVDGHIHLEVDTDPESDSYQLRTMSIPKHRYGPTSHILGFHMESSGPDEPFVIG